MNLFDKFIKKSREPVTEQEIYRPKPEWACDITDEEWLQATEGLPKGKVRTKFFASKDLPF